MAVAGIQVADAVLVVLPAIQSWEAKEKMGNMGKESQKIKRQQSFRKH